jgi:hypothetical protein
MKSLSYNYVNYSEMIESKAHIKGWIPKIMPASAKNIHEWHDIDTNLGYGSFEFDILDFDSFESKMEPIQSEENILAAIIDSRDNWNYDIDKKPELKKIEIVDLQFTNMIIFILL